MLALGAVGAILVAGSAYILTGQDTFPGLNAVPVTLGGCLLLLAGTKQTALSRALSIRPARFIGGISYSMYLWHWPILAYLRYLYVDIDATVGTAVFIAIVILSTLSTRLVEEPFRHSTASMGRVFARMFAWPTAALCAVSYFAIHLGGYLPVVSAPDYAENLARMRDGTQAAYKYPYVCQRSTVRSDDTKNHRAS
ncbi:acyltransferase [Ochrobactrum daejeonense]|nr:acyltransferase [Brucella daejeonensis]